jgi:hypothetical protein
VGNERTGDYSLPMQPSGGAVHQLSHFLILGTLLHEIRRRWSRYELLEHWKQGEFHHDIVLRVPRASPDLGGEVLIIATNCNGGVKEVLCFTRVPDRLALWHARCPDNADFAGDLPPPVGVARTEHWFDPSALLTPDARSELRAEFRERQCGGGWMQRKPLADL